MFEMCDFKKEHKIDYERALQIIEDMTDQPIDKDLVKKLISEQKIVSKKSGKEEE